MIKNDHEYMTENDPEYMTREEREMKGLEHEYMTEEEQETKDHSVDAMDIFSDHIEELFLDAVGNDWTASFRNDLTFEASQLAARLLRLAERADGAEVQGVEDVVRGALGLLCAPKRAAKKIARRVNDWLRGYTAGRVAEKES